MPAGTLLAMSAALAVGAFLAGSLPLWITLSHSHMHKLEAVGTGLLLGAALGVIIPEYVFLSHVFVYLYLLDSSALEV
jgi:zinc transporter 9